MKTCRNCGTAKPLDEFAKQSSNTKDGRQPYCRPCHGEIKRAAAAARRALVQQIKLDRGCADCGYNDHAEALDFDHLPGFAKLFDIGGKIGSTCMETLEFEIAKCDVVCANCHRVRTQARGLHRQKRAS